MLRAQANISQRTYPGNAQSFVKPGQPGTKEWAERVERRALLRRSARGEEQEAELGPGLRHARDVVLAEVEGALKVEVQLLERGEAIEGLEGRALGGWGPGLARGSDFFQSEPAEGGGCGVRGAHGGEDASPHNSGHDLVDFEGVQAAE